jgi:hypothetical protein
MVQLEFQVPDRVRISQRSNDFSVLQVNFLNRVLSPSFEGGKIACNFAFLQQSKKLYRRFVRHFGCRFPTHEFPVKNTDRRKLQDCSIRIAIQFGGLDCD